MICVDHHCHIVWGWFTCQTCIQTVRRCWHWQVTDSFPLFFWRFIYEGYSLTMFIIIIFTSPRQMRALRRNKGVEHKHIRSNCDFFFFFVNSNTKRAKSRSMFGWFRMQFSILLRDEAWCDWYERTEGGRKWMKIGNEIHARFDVSLFVSSKM